MLVSTRYVLKAIRCAVYASRMSWCRKPLAMEKIPELRGGKELGDILSRHYVMKPRLNIHVDHHGGFH